MKHYFRRIMSVFLSAIILYISLPALEFPASAETVNGVEAAIMRILEQYPDGSYFTVNGEPCSHSKTDTCDNCNVLKIRPEMNGIVPPAWTCAAFTRFFMYNVFGVSTFNYASSMISVSASEAKMGDFVSWPGYHYAIYLYSENGKYYFYECNWQGSLTGMVSYNSPHTSISGATFWRAPNYDSVDSGESLELETISERWQVDEPAGVNLRTGAGTGFLAVSVLADGTIFDITRKMSVGGYTWGKTSQGWVALDYCKQLSDEENPTVDGELFLNEMTDESFSVGIKPATYIEGMTASITVKAANDESGYSRTETLAFESDSAVYRVSIADFSGLKGEYIVSATFMIHGSTMYTKQLKVNMCGAEHSGYTEVTKSDGVLNISGFAVSAAGTERYKLLIDGVELMNSAGYYDESLPAVYPYYDLTKAAFAFTYNIARFDSGRHTYEVVAVRNDETYFSLGIGEFIVPSDISTGTVIALAQTYTGKALTPAVSVYFDGSRLNASTDYTVVYANNLNCGTATYTVSGIGNYSGTLSGKFIIKPAAVSNLRTSTRTDSSITIKWNALGGSVNGYEVWRYKTSSGKYVLRTTLTAAASNTYTDTGVVNSGNYKYKVRGFRIINGQRIYGAFSDVLSTTTRPSTPVLTLTAGSGRVTVTWDTVKRASGYQVFWSTSRTGTFTRFKTVTSGSALTATKKSLKTGTRYYFKIRSYRIYNGVKIYSAYSPISGKIAK